MKKNIIPVLVTFLGFINSPVLANALDCRDLMGQALVSTAEYDAIQSLITLKYDPSVSMRIVESSPEIAQRILKGGEKVNPVTVYRGLNMPPGEYDPAGKGTRSATRIFFSGRLTEALVYANYWSDKDGQLRISGEQALYGTVLEQQIPQFLVSATAYTNTQYGTYERSEAPDDSVYITRIGAVKVYNPDYGYEQFDVRNPDIIWFDYQDSFARGKFTKILPPLITGKE